MLSFSVIFVIVLIFKEIHSEKLSLICTAEYCEEYVQRNPCPPLDPICSNSSASLVVPSLTICNCCEHCFIFRDVGEECVIGRPGQPIPKYLCKPGTTCDQGKCVKMQGPDPNFYRGYECENGKCYCAISENNQVKRIFGTFDETKNITKEAQCGCSISAYYAQKAINNFLQTRNAYAPSPRCLADGKFDSLQCLDNMCGCVSRTTGEWDSSVRRVAVSAIGPNNPKCFDPKRHKPGQYYTHCERERNDLMSDVSSESLGEVDILLSHKIECTPDGEYANSYL